jgi:hypothetical protein
MPISRSSSRAARTAVTTSPTLAHRMIMAGRRSTSAFHTLRASSYPAAPGSSNWPSSAELILPVVMTLADVVMVLISNPRRLSVLTAAD